MVVFGAGGAAKLGRAMSVVRRNVRRLIIRMSVLMIGADEGEPRGKGF